MSDGRRTATRVLHLVAGDHGAPVINRLHELFASSEVSRGMRVVQFGWGAALDLPGLIRIPTPLGAAALAARILERVLEVHSRPVGTQWVIHCWSASAALIALKLRSDPSWASMPEIVGVVVEFGDGAAAPRLPWVANLPCDLEIRFVCSSTAAADRLAYLGIAPERCVRIARVVGPAVFEPLGRNAIRSRLGLEPHHEALLAIPTHPWHSGGFLAAWAALLIERIRPNVRFLMPGVDRETERVRYLVESCRRPQLWRTPGDSLSLLELLAAADVATVVPDRAASVEVLPAAMASGTPLVASDLPQIREHVSAGEMALFCKPGDPRGAARRVLETLEDRPAAMRRAAAATTRALRVGTPESMIAQYSRLYAQLFASVRAPGVNKRTSGAL